MARDIRALSKWSRVWILCKGIIETAASDDEKVVMFDCKRSWTISEDLDRVHTEELRLPTSLDAPRSGGQIG